MPDTLSGESLNLSNTLADPTLTIVAHLGKTTIDLDAGAPILLNQLVESDFPGYAPIVDPSFDVFQSDDENHGEAVSDPLRFTAGALTVPQAANVMYLTIQRGNDPAYLWQCFPLAQAWNFDVQGRSYAAQVRLHSLPDAPAPVDQGQVL